MSALSKWTLFRSFQEGILCRLRIFSSSFEAFPSDHSIKDKLFAHCSRSRLQIFTIYCSIFIASHRLLLPNLIWRRSSDLWSTNNFLRRSHSSLLMDVISRRHDGPRISSFEASTLCIVRLFWQSEESFSTLLYHSDNSLTRIFVTILSDEQVRNRTFNYDSLHVWVVCNTSPLARPISGRIPPSGRLSRRVASRVPAAPSFARWREASR